MFSIVLVPSGELDRVRTFYKEVGYGGGASAGDIVLAATVQARVVGVVRLCQENGVTVLRGMFVAPDCQRLGIGRALLAGCLPWLDRGEAWCLPYDHLTGFYQEAGFEPVTSDTLPSFLRERLEGYLAKGQRVRGMRRPAGNHMPNKSLASRMA